MENSIVIEIPRYRKLDGTDHQYQHLTDHRTIEESYCPSHFFTSAFYSQRVKRTPRTIFSLRITIVYGFKHRLQGHILVLNELFSNLLN